MKLTDSQYLASVLEGDSLLVSAAAGSGKTAVLSERVVRKLADEKSGSDADKLIILTYTIAAAGEMRSRITKKLREKIAEDPQNEHLRRQLRLLPAAKICTIHSACLDIIRTNFQLCNLDPQFTVAEENKLALMKSDELEDFVEYLFDIADENEDAKTVIDYFTKGRDDKALSNAIDKTSDFLLTQPYEQQYIDYVCDMPFLTHIENIFTFLEKETEDIAKCYDALCKSADDFPKALDLYMNERDFACMLDKYIRLSNYPKVYECLQSFVFKRHPSKPKDADEHEWELLKSMRSTAKDRIVSIKNNYFYADFDTAKADRKKELAVLKCFLNICKQFNDRLFEKRRRQRLLSFNDIEKYALELLIEGFEDGKPVKTALAKELSENIDEIIVDEFQDCNKTQDLIFSALSKDNKNIFMVGDVKQSIYRFRLADPSIFLQKQKESVTVKEQKQLTSPSRVDLSCNFRSDAKILDFVNTVFEPLMTKDCGGIDYSDGHKLMPKPADEDDPVIPADAESNVELHLLYANEHEDEQVDKLSKTEAEALYVAKKIKSLIEKGKVYNPKTQKTSKVRPSDIAILMRAPRSDGQIFEKALIQEGIPYINNNPAENYLESQEVTSVLAFLQAIDNPYNDIALVTLMYSDFFSFSADELANIRSKNKRTLFYDAVKNYAKTDSKTADFIKKLEYLRSLSLTTDVYGIISAVYETSGILLRISTKKDADSKKANLMLLLDYAANFESVRYRGLFAFISYITKLAEKKDAIASAKLKKSGDCVSIMSIHASKGLEYPIVFLTCCANKFRNSDTSEVMTDSVYGAGLNIRDDKRHIDFYSPAKNFLRAMNHEQDINEYMRYLYVALTRPVRDLYVTGIMSVAEMERMMGSVYYADAKPEKYDVIKNPSFMKWMLFSLINSKECEKLCAFTGVPADKCTKSSDFKIFLESGVAFEQKDEEQTETFCAQQIDKDLAKSLITRKYAFEDDINIPSKLSVSEIKSLHLAKEETAAPVEKRVSFKKPEFLSELSGIEKGNATHSFMQFADFKNITDADSFEKEKIRLVTDEFITVKEAELVEGEKILRFLSSDIIKDLSVNGKLYKEQRFLFTVPANELISTSSSEPVIVQGILDLLYEKDGKAVIIDYKTDFVKDEQTLVSRYKIQLEMYEKAVKKIRGLETSHKYIYSFCLEKFIEV